jgi:hypothetical protein
VLLQRWSGVKRLTLVPERLSDNLVAGGVFLVDILRSALLLDLLVVVLDVATVLIKSSHLDLLFNLVKVDGGHWIGVCKSWAGGAWKVSYS